MKRSAGRRPGKIKMPLDKVARLAAEHDDGYAERIAAGYRLMASSGFWETRGGVRARFVYRKGSPSDPEGRTTWTSVIDFYR